MLIIKSSHCHISSKERKRTEAFKKNISSSITTNEKRRKKKRKKGMNEKKTKGSSHFSFYVR